MQTWLCMRLSQSYNKVPANDEDNNNENCLDEPKPIPFMAFEEPKTLDRYFKTLWFYHRLILLFDKVRKHLHKSNFTISNYCDITVYQFVGSMVKWLEQQYCD